jgi:hypothetical protein
MDEKAEMLKNIPERDLQSWFGVTPNAYVVKDSHGRLGIFFTEGGWLGIPLDSKDLLADIAPWCG